MTDRWLLLTHAAATWFMVGVIWLIQLVHYPLADRVPPGEFPQFEAAHRLRILPVVGPAMALELTTAVLLVQIPPPGVPRWMAVLGLVLALIWAASTVLVQIPLHDRLSAGFDAATHARLVGTNWIRTAAWSIRGALVLAMLARMK